MYFLPGTGQVWEHANHTTRTAANGIWRYVDPLYKFLRMCFLPFYLKTQNSELPSSYLYFFSPGLNLCSSYFFGIGVGAAFGFSSILAPAFHSML